MAYVVIKCPNTGITVPTGFSMDRSSFQSAVLRRNTFAPCPACGKSHKWDKEDAWLEEKRPNVVMRSAVNRP